MSFSQQVKNELCEVKQSCKVCRLAMLYGIILSANTSLTLTTENKAVSELFTSLLVEAVGAIVTINTPDLRVRNKRPTYHISLENPTDISNLIMLTTKSDRLSFDKLNMEILRKPCCRLAFLRGVYLTCGTIIDPTKEYHIELRFKSEQFCYIVLDMLEDLELDFRVTERGRHFILYAKESQQIEDTLTALGAVKSSMELMNLKIEKDLRNTVNRRTNCETANIGRTVNASMTQIEKIEIIKRVQGLDSLPAPVKEVALLRLKNPDASLTELCELSGNRISRSGLNHRLKKLIAIADSLE